MLNVYSDHETVTEQILVKQTSSRVEVVPAKYETVTNQAIKKEVKAQA